ncbi:MAG: LuxR C-terminal-related transcriptional regulator [Planctomycetes bacterium]|nr:LuxR C-terminal-related transcriptional regulator [Planctomycetota bacterium]
MLELMDQGRNTVQIAASMHVSPKSIETYRARIKEKPNLDNITELSQAPPRGWLKTGSFTHVRVGPCVPNASSQSPRTRRVGGPRQLMWTGPVDHDAATGSSPICP